MKFFAKVGSLILGIILGFVLTVGGVAAGGYIAITRQGMVGTVSDLTGGVFNPPADIKKQSLLDYGKNALSVISTFQTSEFGAIEDALGFNISETLASFVGVDKEVVRKSNMGNVFTNLMNSFTVTGVTEKFGITLPSLPLFSDPEFLGKPMVEAFNWLSSQLDVNSLTVRDLGTKFGVVLDGDMFAALQDTKLANLSDAIQGLMLNEMVTVVMQADVDMYAFTHLVDQDGVDTELNDWLQSSDYGNKFAALGSPAGTPVAFDPTTMTYGGNVGEFNYFAPYVVTEGESSVVTPAKDIQANYIAAYNAIETNTVKMVDFVTWAIENPIAYDAFRAYSAEDGEERTKSLSRWEATVKADWIATEKYLTEPAGATALYEAWLAETDAEGQPVNAGKSRTEWLRYYWLDEVNGQFAAYKAIAGNESKTVADYKDYLYEQTIVAWTAENADSDRFDWAFASYVPTNWAPFAAPVMVTATAYSAPTASSPVLQYLYDAKIGALTAKIDTMTVADVTIIDENSHFLLKQVKTSTIQNMGAAMTNAINNAYFKDLMNIVTADDVAEWNESYTADLTAWLVGKVAYDPTNPTAPFDYFETIADRDAFIAAKAAEGETWYAEWEWKAAHNNYYDFDGNFYPEEDGKVELWGATYRAETATYTADLGAWLAANSGKSEHDYILEQYSKAYKDYVAIAGNEGQTEAQWLSNRLGIKVAAGGAKNAWARAYIDAADTYAAEYNAYRGLQDDTADLEAAYLSSRYNAEYAAWTASEGATKTEALWLATVYGIEIAPYNFFTKQVMPEETTEAAPTESTRMLSALAYSTSMTLNADVAGLCIGDLYDVGTTGVLSIVSPYTTITNLPVAIGVKIATLPIITLLEKEVFTYNGQSWSQMNEATKTTLRTQLGVLTVPQLIARYIEFYAILDVNGLLP